MSESILFHSDLYRRDALTAAADKYASRARIAFAERGALIVADLDPCGDTAPGSLRDEFCNEALLATVQSFRNLAPTRAQPASGENAPPWALLSPFREGDALALGWHLESLGPIRSGATCLALRHAQHGVARVTVRRNDGAPLGVAHTEHLDFMLMNGGAGLSQTQDSIGRVLLFMAAKLDRNPPEELLEALTPHAEAALPTAALAATDREGNPGAQTIAASLESSGDILSFDLKDAGLSRLALYDAILSFSDRCFTFLTRPESGSIRIEFKAQSGDREQLAAIADEITEAFERVARSSGSNAAANAHINGGLPSLARPKVIDIDALVAELEAADPMTVGVGFQPERGPGHQDLSVLNILGTGACNSDCLFCCEKFNPGNRLMPSADATRQLILDSAGQFDMLFFASGEPTIHPRLFDYVELAKQSGFRSFGMSSHFRTFADPKFALRTLRAGFEYFDISLHAADVVGQLAVNPIEDNGDSLAEALKGLANIHLLADALGVRVTVTHKIVVSRLNVTELEEIFHATYDRGVRHFILQPVRALGLSPERQAALAITEDEILPYLNDLLRKAEGTGALLKPYGFSRRGLLAGAHVEAERNRVKNIFGKARKPRGHLELPPTTEQRREGEHWIEVREIDPDEEFGFATDGSGVILDEALKRGARLPYGCRMGSCGMCCARLIKGEVDQSTQIFLTDEQVEKGFVLLCQAKPLSDVTVRMCTNDEFDSL